VNRIVLFEEGWSCKTQGKRVVASLSAARGDHQRLKTTAMTREDRNKTNIMIKTVIIRSSRLGVSNHLPKMEVVWILKELPKKRVSNKTVKRLIKTSTEDRRKGVLAPKFIKTTTGNLTTQMN
jgi:hypothetical protein